MITTNKTTALRFHLVNNFIPRFDEQSIENVIDCMTKYWEYKIDLEDIKITIDN